MKVLNILLCLTGLAIIGKIVVDSQTILLPAMGYVVVGVVALVFVGLIFGQRTK
jgi:hypothetical protein